MLLGLCSQPGEEFKGALGVALLEVLDSSVKRGPLLAVETIAGVGEYTTDRDQLDLLSLGAIRRPVEHEVSVPDRIGDRTIRWARRTITARSPHRSSRAVVSDG